MMGIQRPKILLATNHSYMFYRFRKELIIRLNEIGDVTLATPFTGHEDDLRNLGICLIETPMNRRSINPIDDLALRNRYKRLLEEVSPDLVYTFSIKPNIYLGMECAKKRIRYFSHVQGLGTAFQKPGIRSIARILYRFGLRNSSGVFFENTANAEYFFNNHIINQQKPIVLNGAGVDLKSYPILPYPENEKIHILYLGRIMKEKGIDELFDVIEDLSLRYDNFLLDVAGFCEDDYEKRIDSLNKKKILNNHGFVTNPISLYEIADFVVLPSYHEGMSNVLLEAAASGRPLVTTDIPGCREAVSSGKSGFLVHVKDRDSLKEKLEIMLKTPKDMREKMGLEGRKKMENEFSREKIVDETIKVLFSNNPNRIVSK